MRRTLILAILTSSAVLQAQTGSFIFASTQANGPWQVVRLSPNGQGLLYLTPASYNAYGARPSPRNGQLVFQADLSGGMDIYFANIDGSQLRQVTSLGGWNQWASWSPDGGRIVFTHASFPGGQSDLYVVNSNGQGLTQLTNTSEDEGYPVFSPDGSKIAFTRTSGNSDIYVMNRDGSGAANITNDASDSWSLDWSPDGSEIAYHGNQTGAWEIWAVRANGANKRQVTSGGGPNQGPSWTGDGRILFTRGAEQDRIYSCDASGQGMTLRSLVGSLFTNPIEWRKIDRWPTRNGKP